ncbi:hypothetical protein BGW37DRAFT_523089 [Umbelopsis sp. PMI_123]|nr:hypothetical protein BGW37DRAFT_523089 [Umbelopsis sp. PMI_123]
MELLDIGKHCNLISCRQLDFLPLKCPDCQFSFCQEHSHQDAHNCRNKNATQIDIRISTCDLCHKPVPLRNRTEDPGRRMADHLATISADCMFKLRQASLRETSLAKGAQLSTTTKDSESYG